MDRKWNSGINTKLDFIFENKIEFCISYFPFLLLNFHVALKIIFTVLSFFIKGSKL